MACRPAPWAPISAARSGTAAVWIERSTRRWWSPRSARLWLRLCATSDTLWREQERSCCDGKRCEDGSRRAAQHLGLRSAQLGRAQPRCGSSDRLAVGGHRGRRGCGCDSLATSDTLWREHARSCCDDGRCEDGSRRAAQLHGVRSAQLGRAQPRCGSSDRLAVGGHRGGRGCGCDSLATSDRLCRADGRSCCVGRRCEDCLWRAA